jgi:hypothetical protein
VEKFSTDSVGMRSEVRGGSFSAFGSADFLGWGRVEAFTPLEILHANHAPPVGQRIEK